MTHFADSCSIGDERLLDLLTHTAIFVKIDNGCLAQVAGTPVSDTVTDPAKNDKGKGRNGGAVKPSQIAIARHRLFYGRPLFYSTKKKIYAIGLPTTREYVQLHLQSADYVKDVLNRLEHKVNNFTASPSAYLIAHVFPHQHKLRSVFETTNGISMFYNRLMRDAEIKVCTPCLHSFGLIAYRHLSPKHHRG